MKERIYSSLSSNGLVCCEPEGFRAICWESSSNCVSAPWSKSRIMNLSGISAVL